MSLKRVPPGLKRFIDEGSRFVIIGHKDPDGDCICSQLGLAGFLRRRGKKVHLVSPGPFRRLEVMPFAASFSSSLGAAERRGARLIIVDCSSPDRLGALAARLEGLPTAVIDHHETHRAPGGVNYIDPAAPSVTIMIQRLIESFGDAPDDREAYLLFYGLCTDTGFFRHISENAGEVLAAAARLMRDGVSPQRLYRDLYSGRSLASRKYLGGGLHNAEARFGGRLILTRPKAGERFAQLDQETDPIYQALLAVQGCQALAYLRENSRGELEVSLRSTGACNVARIAEQFGGGGHAQAAGFSLAADEKELEKRLLAAFRREFSK